MKLWGGRFDEGMDALMERFNASIGFDWKMWAADTEGSIAYAAALARSGLITADEHAALENGLRQVQAEFKRGEFEIRLSDEDIHTAVERRLGEIVGTVAGKLHTGRSRNDQVATDLRLHLRAVIDEELDGLLRDVQAALLEQARAHVDTLMPGYTHVQRAQPVPAAHWLLSFFWPLHRDRERLSDLRRRLNVMPLGAGALAGNPFGVDRAWLAAELGFDDVTPNSMDAVSDRDFAAELLFTGALIGTHLSRLAEDLVFYSSAEYGFVRLADRYSTGSSIMPQKKNPDSMELARGKSGRLLGNLVTLMTVLKGLPSTYNKDMQEDKEPIFDTLDTLRMTLPVVAGAVGTMSLNAERMVAALDDSMLATDIADELVRIGVPFREAHGLVGRLVRRAEALDVQLGALPAAEVAGVHSGLAAGYRDLFDMQRSVDARSVAGGTARAAVEQQIAAAETALARKVEDHG